MAWALFTQQSTGTPVCSHNGKSLPQQPVFVEGFLYAGQCFKHLRFNSLASNCVYQWEWMNSVSAGASKDKYISDAHGWKRWSEKSSHKNCMSQTQWNNTVQGYTLKKGGAGNKGSDIEQQMSLQKSVSFTSSNSADGGSDLYTNNIPQ